MMLTTVEIERLNRLVRAETAARKTTDWIVRIMGLSGQPLTDEAIEGLYRKNLSRQPELIKEDQ